MLATRLASELIDAGEMKSLALLFLLFWR